MDSTMFVVKWLSSAGDVRWHPIDNLEAAAAYVEHLRNSDGVDGAKIFRLEEVAFELKPVYRVELASAPAVSFATSIAPEPEPVAPVAPAAPAPVPAPVAAALAPEPAAPEAPAAALELVPPAAPDSVAVPAAEPVAVEGSVPPPLPPLGEPVAAVPPSVWAETTSGEPAANGAPRRGLFGR